MRKMLVVLCALALLLSLAAPALAAAPGTVPWPRQRGLLVGYVGTDNGYAYVNGTYRGLSGGWFTMSMPAGEQVVHAVVIGGNVSTQTVRVPANGVVVVSFGNLD